MYCPLPGERGSVRSRSLADFSVLANWTGLIKLKMPSKLIRILRITFCYKQLCGRCLVQMTPVVKVVIHCVFALL